MSTQKNPEEEDDKEEDEEEEEATAAAAAALFNVTRFVLSDAMSGNSISMRGCAVWKQARSVMSTRWLVTITLMGRIEGDGEDDEEFVDVEICVVVDDVESVTAGAEVDPLRRLKPGDADVDAVVFVFVVADAYGDARIAASF